VPINAIWSWDLYDESVNLITRLTQTEPGNCDD
jgi:hypothetical protein